MIKIDRILKQAWRILWNYRMLWIFGLLLALTAGGAGNQLNYNLNNGSRPSPTPSFNLPAGAQPFTQWFQSNVTPLLTHPAQHITTFIWIILAVVLIFLALGLLVAVVRYPVETAIIRMVDDYEQTGARLGFRAGWRLGWNRRAFRLWVIDLITGLPIFVLFLILVALGLTIFSSVYASGQVSAFMGSLAAIVAFVLVLLVFFVLIVFLGLLRNLFSRAAALDGLSVSDSLRGGWALFKKQWKNAGLMWLVMIGIGLGFGLLASILFFLLIPAYLVMLIPAGLIAALPGLLTYGISSLITSGPWVWIATVLAALPFFLTVLFSPIIFVSGLYKIFESSTWTLVYREIRATPEPSLPETAAS
jgi:hypothetical protein